MSQSSIFLHQVNFSNPKKCFPLQITEHKAKKIAIQKISVLVSKIQKSKDWNSDTDADTDVI